MDNLLNSWQILDNEIRQSSGTITFHGEIIGYSDSLSVSSPLVCRTAVTLLFTPLELLGLSITDLPGVLLPIRGVILMFGVLGT